LGKFNPAIPKIADRDTYRHLLHSKPDLQFLEVSVLKDARGAVIRRREVAPFVWQDPAGQIHLAADRMLGVGTEGEGR
jgi:hypothetical protein